MFDGGIESPGNSVSVSNITFLVVTNYGGCKRAQSKGLQTILSVLLLDLLYYVGIVINSFIIFKNEDFVVARVVDCRSKSNNDQKQPDSTLEQ